MDKKNLIIGIALIGAAFALMVTQSPVPPEPTPARPATTEAAPSPTPSAPEAGERQMFSGEETAPAERSGTDAGIFQRESDPSRDLLVETVAAAIDELVILDNGTIRVAFTSAGGAIRYVEFVADRAGRLAYPETLNGDSPYRFNRGADVPALAISLATGADGRPQEFAPQYRVLDRGPRHVVFGYRDASGGRIVRSYELQGPESTIDPYVIAHDTKFINDQAEPLNLSQIYLNVGTAPPTEGDQADEFLNFGYDRDGKTKFLRSGEFRASGGFLGIGSRPARPFLMETFGAASLTWAAVKNQFFTSVLTPETLRGSGYFTRPVDLSSGMTEDIGRSTGVTGALSFDLGRLPPGGERLLRATYYVGPKEFFRLDSLPGNQDEVMQFGYMGVVSKFLLLCLRGLHDLLSPISGTWAWGFAIISLTVIIKGILWPLTQVQVRSAKRMAELSAPMKAINEKYKDDPTERQKAIMKLFSDHKVNPAAGCLPILVQMPIFIGLFFMLRTSSELRFAPFLWMSDLSVADTLFMLGPIPFNLLPLLMGAAQVMQMRLTPSPSADPAQKAMLQFMPIIFLVICYSFPSGVVLYWTVQTALGVLQQLITNRIKDTEDIKIEAELASDAAKTKGKGANARPASGQVTQPAAKSGANPGATALAKSPAPKPTGNAAGQRPQQRKPNQRPKRRR